MHITYQSLYLAYSLFKRYDLIHITGGACLVPSPPLQWCLIVYEHLWPMTFVITVTTEGFMLRKQSVSTIASPLHLTHHHHHHHQCRHATGVHWHHLPCEQWVRILTDCLGRLVLQSVKTAFVEHNIPDQSHW